MSCDPLQDMTIFDGDVIKYLRAYSSFYSDRHAP